MRKIIILGTITLAAFLLSGCGNQPQSSTKNVSQPAGVVEVLQQGMAAADAVQEPVIETIEPTPTPTVTPFPLPEFSAEGISALAENPEEGIDIDLTKLSSTMIYAEVYAMMTNSHEYIGKTIRMRGTNSSFYDRNTDTYYYACLIRDALACCAQGIEFVLTDDYILPDDYPAEGAEITVTGVFESYQENQFTFYHLTNAVLSN